MYTLILHLVFTGNYHLYIQYYIYIELVLKLRETASVTQSVECWSRDPEVTGSIPSPRP